MQKRKGTISKTLSSLRFMQNAARAVQEQEVEASKAKVRTEEEWELPKELWGGEAAATSEDQLVTYEPSYLPFLFPGFAGGTSSVKAAMAVNGIAVRTEGLTGQYQCRRKMAKQIAEELGQEDEDVQHLPSSKEKKIKVPGILPRGARSISRAAAPSAKLPPPTKPPAPEGFLKPHVESPQSKKRQASQSDHQPKRQRTEETIL